MQMQKELRFYEYDQNNSGGGFDYNEQAGISVKVIVQATGYEDANARAQGIGLYFDGEGDCFCCGDRWYAKCGEEGMDLASLKQRFTDWADGKWFMKWMQPDQPEVFVHFADGRVLGLVFGEAGNYRFTQSGGGLLALDD